MSDAEPEPEDNNVNNNDDDHDGDYTVGDDAESFSPLQRLQHWLGKHGYATITPNIRAAVEAVFMHVAYVSVVTGPACSKNVQEQKCLCQSSTLHLSSCSQGSWTTVPPW